MQRTKILWITISLIAAVAVGLIIGSKHRTETSEVNVVHTYSMAFEQADNFKNMLNRLFSNQQGAPVASAQSLSSGALIVRAPESMIPGIDDMIARLEKQAAVARRAIRMDYWVVIGEPAKASNAEASAILATPLGAIDKVDGPRNYRVLEHLSSSSISDHEVFVEGSVAKVNATAMTRENNVGLRLDIKSRLGTVRTDTQTKAGEFVVLGQNTLEPGISIGNQKVSNSPANVYYIVRADYVN